MTPQVRTYTQVIADALARAAPARVTAGVFVMLLSAEAAMSALKVPFTVDTDDFRSLDPLSSPTAIGKASL